MTPEQQRIAIAEACGWANIRWNGVRYNWVGHRPETARDDYALPDYLNDLNAMHEAEKALSSQDKIEYAFQINGGCYTSGLDDTFNIVHATAAERAEAFLRTLNLWKP